MTRDKPITVSIAGGGQTKETVVQEGDSPRDVLARAVEANPDACLLRSGAGTAFDADADVFREVREGDALFVTRPSVVGGGEQLPKVG